MSTKVVRQFSELSTDDTKAIMESVNLAFDCEGVELGRDGEMCIVTLATLTQTYLFDVYGFDKNADIIPFLKEVLENPAIKKIIHDVRMDADALYHLLGISVTGVFDTQAWDMALTNGGNRNLNNTLIAYSCPTNDARDNSVYETNIRFWATRPLTPTMITWASEDVINLFLLKQRQLEKASSMPQPISAIFESESRAAYVREMSQLKLIKIRNSMIGKFIGSKGSNIEWLTRVNPGIVIRNRGNKGCGEFWIYSINANVERKFLASITRYQ